MSTSTKVLFTLAILTVLFSVAMGRKCDGPLGVAGVCADECDGAISAVGKCPSPQKCCLRTGVLGLGG